MFQQILYAPRLDLPAPLLLKRQHATACLMFTPLACNAPAPKRRRYLRDGSNKAVVAFSRPSPPL
jgi:hypothetical protein